MPSSARNKQKIPRRPVQFFFFNDTATTKIYTLSLHDALPICALALSQGWLPPTINLERPDPQCDLDCLPGGGKTASPAAVVSNSFGFGGINAALVLRPDGGAR